MQKISVIIPVYNEENSIYSTLASVENFFNDKNFDLEIIVVDDGSKDKTVIDVNKFFENSLKKDSHTLLENKENRGKGFSVKRGMLRAAGDFCLFMDADSSTNIEEFTKCFSFFEDGYDIVIGSRHEEDKSVKVIQRLDRLILGKASNWLIRLVLNLQFHDTQCGFKIFSKSSIKEIFPYQLIDRWGFDFEILYLAKKRNFKVKETPVNWHYCKGSRVRLIQGILFALYELIKVRVNSFRGDYVQKK